MNTMTPRQRTAVVTLVSFTLILVAYVIILAPYVLSGELTTAPLKKLWVTVIFGSAIVVIAGIIITQTIASATLAVTEGKEAAEAEAYQADDERDRLIDLKGKSTAYLFLSIGMTTAMLTYLFDYPPAVMFSLLIFFGLLGEIAGDVRRLLLYRKGV